MKANALFRLIAISSFSAALLSTANANAQPVTIKADKAPIIASGADQSEVLKQLGEPENKPTWASGKTTWTYRTDVPYKRFDVDFGKDGRVERVGFYNTYNEVSN